MLRQDAAEGAGGRTVGRWSLVVIAVVLAAGAVVAGTLLFGRQDDSPAGRAERLVDEVRRQGRGDTLRNILQAMHIPWSGSNGRRTWDEIHEDVLAIGREARPVLVKSLNDRGPGVLAVLHCGPRRDRRSQRRVGADAGAERRR